MAAQAEAVVCQKAASVAVEGRERSITDQRCFGGAVHSVHKRLVLRVCPIAREPCMFGVAGVRGVRACVYRHQPLSDAAAGMGNV